MWVEQGGAWRGDAVAAGEWVKVLTIYKLVDRGAVKEALREALQRAPMCLLLPLPPQPGQPHDSGVRPHPCSDAPPPLPPPLVISGCHFSQVCRRALQRTWALLAAMLHALCALPGLRAAAAALWHHALAEGAVKA